MLIVPLDLLPLGPVCLSVQSDITLPLRGVTAHVAQSVQADGGTSGEEWSLRLWGQHTHHHSQRKEQSESIKMIVVAVFKSL